MKDPRGTTTQRGLGWSYQRKRAYILERDRGICWLCNHPGATTVDHVVPRAQGGDDSDENLRAAHAECNYARPGNERRGFSKQIDASGWPTDERHPANRRA